MYVDRAARMEVAKIEVRCDYCKTWSDKEEKLQVILDNTVLAAVNLVNHYTRRARRSKFIVSH